MEKQVNIQELKRQIGKLKQIANRLHSFILSILVLRARDKPAAKPQKLQDVLGFLKYSENPVLTQRSHRDSTEIRPSQHLRKPAVFVRPPPLLRFYATQRVN